MFSLQSLATDSEIEQLKEELSILQRKIDSHLSESRRPQKAKTDSSELDVKRGEIRDTHRVEAGKELVREDFPGSWPLFGTDSRMKFGGYFKLDGMYDFDGTSDKDQFLISTIPVDNTPESKKDSYFNTTIRETRFNFDVRKFDDSEPSQQFFLEMDFYDRNNTAPRLRHAYVVYGNLLMGQTWTTLSELRSLPFMIDFAYGDALFGGRTVQLRWEDELGKNKKWAVGIEKVVDSGIDNPFDLPGNPIIKLPILSAKLNLENSKRLLMFGGTVGQLNWDGEETGKDSSHMQWALLIAGRKYFGKNRDYFTWNLSYGNGAASNIMALVGSNANASLDENGNLKTNKAWCAALGYAHNFNDTISSNFALAWTELERSNLRSDGSIAGGGVLHVNLIKHISKNYSTGIEYMQGRRINNDGESGRAERIQTMVKYDF